MEMLLLNVLNILKCLKNVHPTIVFQDKTHSINNVFIKDQIMNILLTFLSNLIHSKVDIDWVNVVFDALDGNFKDFNLKKITTIFWLNNPPKKEGWDA